MVDAVTDRERDRQVALQQAKDRLKAFGTDDVVTLLDLADITVAHTTDNFIQVTVRMDAHDLADVLQTLTASRDAWLTLAGDWETRARRALKGMKGSNNLMHIWRERALSAEDKLRVLTTPRDDDPGDDA